MGLQPATFGSQLREKNNRPAGFDYLRIILSLGIIAWHTILVCYGEPTEARYWSGPFRPVFYFLVPSFFALSGFLVAGSLERNDIPSFLTLRAIRIYPALACEAILSAFILGPLVTSWSLGDYFSHQSFLNYLWNIIGYVHFTLPGVFDSNPGGPKVNQQLWTIPYELECYAAIAVLAIFKITKHPNAFFYALALACIAIVTYQYYGSTFRPIDRSPPGRMLVISFLFGAALFFIKDKVRFNGMLLALT
jgi:peptidoglycan/LPS O-acetylase OafA/YrhL